jgi:hypothetical protein
MGNQTVIYYVHGQSVSCRSAGASRARVRNVHRDVSRSGRPLRHPFQHAALLGPARPGIGGRGTLGPRRGLAIAGGCRGPAPVGSRPSRSDHRRIDAGVQRGRRAPGPRPPVQHLARFATDRIRLQKKRSRPVEQDRASVQAERRAFRQWIARVDPRCSVFLDESGANLAMGRSHAWLPRGTELIEPRPRNWGDNLTLVGAIRVDRWLAPGAHWGAMTTGRLVTWVRRRLVRHLRPGDVVVLDQPSRAQSALGAGVDRGGWRDGALLAAILPRLQSD